MEQEAKQHPYIGQYCRSMQRMAHEYAKQIITRQLDVKSITVGSTNGFELTLTDYVWTTPIVVTRYSAADTPTCSKYRYGCRATTIPPRLITCWNFRLCSTASLGLAWKEQFRIGVVTQNPILSTPLPARLWRVSSED